MKRIDFLTLAEIIEIHMNQIDLYGGDSCLKDITLLQSAMALPESTFDNKFLHKDIYEMAAAYAFHICQNHPFVDGNKRVGLVTALVFLDFNGIDIDDPNELLYKAMMDVASGKLNKEKFADVFRSLNNVT
ncbi:MAG TPA: type II toxin-antitoxin system death-on-curing family toxin [Spirochaetota bacterium]|jgi:death-on-curing protein|nr:type II toxin-antitoxin system death-on-curing family toxin [Spirochaetota bacterium]HOH37036.1 type II toxin-antitoxin system death-on-curing family toxin [Spirochaetota bacterium]HPJ15407.1 type II toxin-antitoxin system death-on-curing family toxin [Spirochaetota bacterium]HPY02698.1 type II toxin-antitoxin system death-on-curing family toxin [Spirochaetota bacterium]HQA51314.1 type II toxin-antitoxin system death-on-curing family toxin [Spirochaetota bacterium]